MTNTKNGVATTATTTNRNGSRKKRTRPVENTGNQVRVTFIDATGTMQTHTIPEKLLFIQMDGRSASLYLGARSPKLTVFQPKSVSRFSKETIAV